MRAVDCQGFAGGFTLGTVRAGFELVHKAEMIGGFGTANCEANRHLLGNGWDAQACDPAEWEPMANVDFMFGNPPCSGFSLLSSRAFRGIDSPINHCMWAFSEYVGRTRPAVAAFESVQQAYSKGEPLMRRLWEKLKADTGIDWRLYHVKHDNKALGGCATRKRYFWVVSTVPLGVEMPELERVAVLRDAIEDLEDLPLSWAEQPYTSEPTWWSKDRRVNGGVDGHHPHERATMHIKRLFSLYEGSKPWAEGEYLSVWVRRYYERNGCLPEPWAHQTDKIIAKNFEMGFHQPKRWNYDKSAFVITGGGPVSVVHPTQLRLITYREVARVMGYPDDWLIEPLRETSTLQAGWGKGIPVGSGEWLATWVKRSIEGVPGSITGDMVGENEYLIDATKPQMKELAA